MVAESTSSWNGSGNILLSPDAVIRANGNTTTFTLSGSGGITGGSQATLAAFNGANLIIARPITLTGPAGLRKTGNGTLHINQAASYAGPTLLDNGTILTGAANVLPAATVLTAANSTTLNLNNFPQRIGGISGAAAVNLGTATLTLNPSTNMSATGVISGSGGLVIEGNGTASQALSGSNTFIGPTTVRNNGRLLLAAPTGNPLSPTAPLTLDNGGTVAVDFSNTIIGGLLGAGHIEFQSGGNLLRALTISTNSASSNFSGSSSGPGRIIKDGTNDTLFLIGATLLHSGETRVKNGTINKNAATTMPNTQVVVEANGTFSGFGTLKSFEIDGGTINPGLTTENNVQLTTTETSIFRAGAKYEWRIDDWNGTGGNGHNLIAPQGLQLTTTAAAPLLIRVNAPAVLANFTESPRVFKIIRCNTPIAGNDPTAIAVEYSNNAAGLTGTWSARIAGNDLELVYTPSGGDTYESWIAGFNVGGLDAPTDDPDGDGIPNAIEYVIGGNPKDSDDSAKLPTSEIDGTDFVFVFRRTTRSLYLDPAVHHSTTLEAPWTRAVNSVNGVTITTTPLDTETDECTVRIPLAAAPRRFARMEVTIP